jgi:membrane protease YdiL (CAAX protease family)
MDPSSRYFMLKRYDMRTIINWKLFLVLWIASILGGVCVIPYVSTNALLKPVLHTIPMQVLIALVLLESGILFAVFIFVGLLLGKRVDLGLPLVSARLQNLPFPGFGRTALFSIMGGLVGGALVFILDRYVFGMFIPPITMAQDNASWWSRFLVCLYGGFNEEIAIHFALMTTLVWIAWKIKSTPENKPTKLGVWTAIIVASIIFGVLHLPTSGRMVVITPLAIVRAIALNSIIGVPCGVLYWRKGLEAAIVVHFSCDVMLHGLLPLLA